MSNSGQQNWIAQVISSIGEVVKQADSNTKLLAVILIAGIFFLTFIAASGAEGTLRYIVVIAAVIIVLFGLYLAGSLEKTRLVQGNYYKTVISSSRKQQSKTFDAFISAPMDTSLDGSGNVIGRDQIMKIKTNLERACDFQSIFYAAAEKTRKTDFDLNSAALSKNYEFLAKSKRHIFIFPERKPSSTLVEVGMALALGIPSIWFVKSNVKLPFLLEQAWQSSSTVNSYLPKILVHRYTDTEDIIRFIYDKRNDLTSM